MERSYWRVIIQVRRLFLMRQQAALFENGPSARIQSLVIICGVLPATRYWLAWKRKESRRQEISLPNLPPCFLACLLRLRFGKGKVKYKKCSRKLIHLQLAAI